MLRRVLLAVMVVEAFGLHHRGLSRVPVPLSSHRAGSRPVLRCCGGGETYDDVEHDVDELDSMADQDDDGVPVGVSVNDGVSIRAAFGIACSSELNAALFNLGFTMLLAGFMIGTKVYLG